MDAGSRFKFWFEQIYVGRKLAKPVSSSYISGEKLSSWATLIREDYRPAGTCVVIELLATYWFIMYSDANMPLWANE